MQICIIVFQEFLDQILFLPLTNYMLLGKFLNLSWISASKLVK